MQSIPLYTADGDVALIPVSLLCIDRLKYTVPKHEFHDYTCEEFGMNTLIQVVFRDFGKESANWYHINEQLQMVITNEWMEMLTFKSTVLSGIWTICSKVDTTDYKKKLKYLHGAPSLQLALKWIIFIGKFNVIDFGVRKGIEKAKEME